MREKVSTIGLLAVIIALVMVVGLGVVNAAEQTHKININEPGPETTESSVNISGNVSYLNGTVDESINKDAELIYGDKNETIHVVNGTFKHPVTLSWGKNELEIKIETEEGPLSTIHKVTYNPPFMTWILVGAIVVVSFLIFYLFKNTFKNKLSGWIFGILFAVSISSVLVGFKMFCASTIMGFDEIHAYVAILSSLGVPLLYIVLDPLLYIVLDHFLPSKEERKERKEEELPKKVPESFDVKFKVIDEKTKQPISDAKILVTESGSEICEGPTDQRGIYECSCSLKSGTYKYKIEPGGAYKPKSGSLLVERSSTFSIPLTARTGNVTVQVKDRETGTPVQGVNVSVSGVEKRTDEQGHAFFTDVPIGVKEIKVEETKGVYSSETTQCEIKEDAANEVSILIKSLLRIPIDKESKLNALRNQLQDNWRRLSTYDSCIPSYYRGIVDNMVNLAKGMAGKPMLFVGSKNNPGETVGHLIDVIDLASHEVIGVMTSKRNVDVYSAAMRLENAEVEVKPVNLDDSRVLDYIRDAEAFYNSYYHTVQSKLFEVDTTITRKTGEMNVLPVSGLWRVARTLLNETSASTAETDIVKKGAMTLVADILLDYTDDMLKDAKIIERLKIMVI